MDFSKLQYIDLSEYHLEEIPYEYNAYNIPREIRNMCIQAEGKGFSRLLRISTRNVVFNKEGKLFPKLVYQTNMSLDLDYKHVQGQLRDLPANLVEYGFADKLIKEDRRSVTTSRTFYAIIRVSDAYSEMIYNAKVNEENAKLLAARMESEKVEAFKKQIESNAPDIIITITKKLRDYFRYKDPFWFQIDPTGIWHVREGSWDAVGSPKTAIQILRFNEIGMKDLDDLIQCRGLAEALCDEIASETILSNGESVVFKKRQSGDNIHEIVSRPYVEILFEIHKPLRTW